jgi:D-alanine-D-alanine ligase-like ATP-grasp enzyme
VRDIAPSFVTTLLKRILPTVGASLICEPINEHVGLIQFANGRRSFFRDVVFNINPVGSCELAIDKFASTFFLGHFGYSATNCCRVSRPSGLTGVSLDDSLDHGRRFAERIGFPVILKPNSFSEGKFVTKVFSPQEFYTVATSILAVTDTMLVEQFYPGNDYRLVVFDGHLVAAYQRRPLSVVGDGVSSIYTQLLAKQAAYGEAGMGRIIDIDDYRIGLRLKQLKIDLDTILPDQECVYVLDNANLSTGGTSQDVTEQVHPDFANLAVSICADMQLRLCGVDIITTDISQSISNYVVIEINSAPGMRHFSSLSANHLRKVEEIYRSILNHLEYD